MYLPDLYQHFLDSTGVSTDTRSIQKGNIYFALKGENFNGHKFVHQALDAGASLVVIDEADYQGEHTFLVDNVLKTLQDLGRHHRENLTIPVIGLTGSNGKTTSKELIAAVLSTQFNAAFTRGNLNNHIGVPLTLLSINKEHEIAIVEMGANHLGEIEFLCSLCQPDYGYITNFGKAHLEGFGGIEGVIKGKSELYDFIRLHGKKVLVNIDDEIQVEKTRDLSPITFGESERAKYTLQLIPDPEIETLAVAFEGIIIHTHLTGNYNFSNVGAAIAVGKHFGISTRKIKEGIESYRPQNNRSQIQHSEKNTLIIDTYNANPSSMEAALRNFEQLGGHHKWVILGDMFELGSYAASEHQRIADLVKTKNFERILLVGKAFTATRTEEDHSLLKFSSTGELLAFLEREQPAQKTILLKGSRGMKIERAIDLL